MRNLIIKYHKWNIKECEFWIKKLEKDIEKSKNKIKKYGI